MNEVVKTAEANEVKNEKNLVVNGNFERFSFKDFTDEELLNDYNIIYKNYAELYKTYSALLHRIQEVERDLNYFENEKTKADKKVVKINSCKSVLKMLDKLLDGIKSDINELDTRLLNIGFEYKRVEQFKMSVSYSFN